MIRNIYSMQMRSQFLVIIFLWLITNPVKAQWDLIGEVQRSTMFTSELTGYYLVNYSTGTPSSPESVGHLIKTNDGAKTWHYIYNTGEPYYIGVICDIQFVNDDLGWMQVSYGGIPFETHYFLEQTTDGGISWTNLNAPYSISDYKYDFLKQDYGYISPIGLNPTQIILYRDGNWTTQCDTNIFNFRYDSFFFINDSTGFILLPIWELLGHI